MKQEDENLYKKSQTTADSKQVCGIWEACDDLYSYTEFLSYTAWLGSLGLERPPHTQGYLMSAFQTG